MERAAMWSTVDSRVGVDLMGKTAKFPLANVPLDTRNGHAEAQTYPPVFRRFLLARMTDRLGGQGVANTRRELAALARDGGAFDLAVQILLEGDLVPEAVERADREVDMLRRPGRLGAPRPLARVLAPE